MSPALPLFDPYRAELINDPYPIYKRYREADPVHWGLSQAPGADGCWYLFRAREIGAVLKDPRFRRRAAKPASPRPLPKRPAPKRSAPERSVPEAQRPFIEMSKRWLLSSDPPDHTRLRSLVHKAFTAKVAERLRAEIVRTADALLDEVMPKGRMDLIADYAFPLSFSVITAILGVSAADKDMFRRWSSDVGEGINFRKADADTFVRASQGTIGLTNYFRELLQARRKEPRDDLVSALIAASEEEDKLSEEELLAMCIQLIFAGHETTVNLIGNGAHALLRHPQQWQRLRDEPALLPGAIHELLRYDASVQTAAARKPIEDVELGGKVIRAGQPVIAVLGAANRDPALYAHPDVLDIERDATRHLAFGLGIHTCLGAFLARAEGEVGLGRLSARLPQLRLATDEALPFREHVVLRGLLRLPVVF